MNLEDKLFMWSAVWLLLISLNYDGSVLEITGFFDFVFLIVPTILASFLIFMYPILVLVDLGELGTELKGEKVKDK